MTYEEACAYIEGLVKFTAKHSVDHTRTCLDRLGNPDRGFSSIHIAGTNGKGSVSAFLAAVLKRTGKRTGLFTSPHLIRVNERMRIDGREIPDGDFLAIFEKVRTVSLQMEAEGLGHPSYFEFLFLMAMVWFAKEGVEVAVIETGLGGRLDATNALEKPCLTIITAIGLDHTQYLGTTIREIAGEKAGIIKPYVPCVYLADQKEVTAVIADRAAALKAPAYPLTDQMWQAKRREDGKIDFFTSFRYDGIREYHTSSPAVYQAENGALAVLGLKVLRESDPKNWRVLTGKCLKEGIASMTWRGRMEEIRPHIWLDGAHNDNGIRRFLETAEEITKGRPAGLLFAVVRDKEFSDMIRDLATAISWDYVVVAEVGGQRRTDPEDLAELFHEAGVRRVFAVKDPEEAFEQAVRMQGERDLFVCGSLYLIGKIEGMFHDQL